MILNGDEFDGDANKHFLFCQVIKRDSISSMGSECR